MRPPTRTPDWLLERIALGELPPEELAAARARLLQEPDGAARLSALEADTAACLARHPPAEVAHRVGSRARVSRARGMLPARGFLPVLTLVPALAAAALVVLVRPQVPAPVGPETELTRIKGLEPRLTLYRQHQDAAEPLAEGTRAAPGDVVQLAYVAAGRAQGVILSVDGRGTLTLHAPESGATSVPLAPSGTHALPGAYALDDAPGFERFFLVTAETPFALDEVLAAARSLAGHPEARNSPLPLPSRYTQTSFLLEKTSP
ncbi:ActD-like protein [Vitiosangium sp. GDMCC 1.1324]|uniref:ActD-like protein n=1 Tax=Vitiosangium sp. (strain GDMCC 1.1324) TaxID=2138576 RepID=UPI000D3585D9|nr:ActD-like protein [Vitiosangium sp. GDMCC 1.1324]PTL84823.1 ActD-like protein [Vitiosangium sp. GDMCC 1.1324]